VAFDVKKKYNVNHCTLFNFWPVPRQVGHDTKLLMPLLRGSSTRPAPLHVLHFFSFKSFVSLFSFFFFAIYPPEIVKYKLAIFD